MDGIGQGTEERQHVVGSRGDASGAEGAVAAGGGGADADEVLGVDSFAIFDRSSKLMRGKAFVSPPVGIAASPNGVSDAGDSFAAAPKMSLPCAWNALVAKLSDGGGAANGDSACCGAGAAADAAGACDLA